METDDIITLQGNCPKFAVLYPPSEMGAIFNQLREKLKKLFPHTAGMADTLDLLYSDYQSNYKTNQYIWSPDFSIQFCCVLKHLNCACENLQDNSKDFLDKIRDLTNAFNQQIYHMFDSGNNMYLELPSCHLRYTGQQDMILYAYFGILKDILFYMNEEVTSQKRSYQPRLIPFVTIDVVPIIETDFYPDNSEYDEDRPVILNLPSAALFDLPPHIAYIVHELFHYTTPKNRFTRNKLYLFVYFTEYMVGVVYEALMLFINNQIGTVEKPKEKLLTALSPVIRKSCFHYISQQIDEICDELQIYSHYRETSKKINAFFMLDILMEDVISILDLIAEDPKDDGATPCPGLLKKLRSILSNFFNVSEYQYLELILNEIYNLQNNVLDEEFRCAVKTLENQIKTRKNYVEKTKGVPQKQNNDSKTDEPAESKLFRCVVKKLKQETIYNDTIGVFREVSADIAMVDLCGMDLVEYIFHYVRTKKNMLQDKNTRVLQTKDLLRIGILLDCLIEKNKEGANESHKKQFICRYITHYLKKDGQEKVLENDDTIKNLKKNGQEKVNDLRKEAESWFDYIVANYRAYIQIYTSYRVRLFPDIIKQYTISEMLCQSFIKKYKFKEYRSITQACMDAVGLYLESKGDKQTYAMMVGAKKDYDAKIFELNVSLILQSQKQKYLSDIKPSSKTNAREKDDSKFSEKYKSEIGITPDLKSKPEISRIRKVYSLEELLRAMLECSQDLKGVQKTFYESQIPVVWYRGEESDEWLLLPKLLRMAQEKGDARRLSILQRENMGIFKSICESMDLGAVSAKTDSLSMIINMQHYGVGTNFLDWSEDAMSSLYFALRNTVEPNIDHLEGREWEARRKSFPTIYLFSPLLYNEALREFLQKYLDEKDKAGCRKAPAVEMVENLIDAWERGLPNISLEEYGDIFNPYIAGNIKIEKTLMRQGGDKINPFLPLAILPSRINPRIQAQSGNFIAFNLFAEGEADENNKFCSYAYLNLKKIQEQFIEFFGKTDSDIRKYIFLYQIILASAEAKEEVAAFVKATGMGAERVYPELQNIIEKKFKK